MPRTLVVGAILICFGATIVNLYVFNTLGQAKALEFRDIVQLRRPNQFIGLDRAKMHPEAPSILTYPNLLSQINRAEPHRVYGDDPDRFAAWGGFVAPDDREFKVTPKVSILPFQRLFTDLVFFRYRPLSSSKPLTTRWRIASSFSGCHIILLEPGQLEETFWTFGHSELLIASTLGRFHGKHVPQESTKSTRYQWRSPQITHTVLIAPSTRFTPSNSVPGTMAHT